jgi:hypothetical protein
VKVVRRVFLYGKPFVWQLDGARLRLAPVEVVSTVGGVPVVQLDEEEFEGQHSEAFIPPCRDRARRWIPGYVPDAVQ